MAARASNRCQYFWQDWAKSQYRNYLCSRSNIAVSEYVVVHTGGMAASSGVSVIVYDSTVACSHNRAGWKPCQCRGRKDRFGFAVRNSTIREGSVL